MSASLAALALGLVAGLGFALATSLLVSVAWVPIRALLRARHPAERAGLALATAVAPGLVPVLLVGICFVPGELAALGLHADHCSHHPGHPHLCLAHATAHLTWPLAILLAVAGALLVRASTRLALRAAGGRRVLAKLRAGVSHDLRPGVRCVDSERPFSFNAGPGRGEIFLSSALVDALPPDQLEIVVEHERAHGRRRDGLRRLLAQALSWPHRPALRRELLEELDLATERACDEAAARRLGDRLGVAEAILAVEKLAGAAPGATPIPFPAFGGSSVPARVQALLGDPGDEAAVQVRWWVGAVVVASGLLTYPIHHLTEHALGLLFGAP